MEQLVANAAFGSGHPYARSPLGTVDSVTPMGIEEVVDRQLDVFVPKGATLLVAGDVRPDAVAAAAKAAFGRWDGEPASPLAAVPPPRVTAGSTEVGFLERRSRQHPAGLRYPPALRHPRIGCRARRSRQHPRARSGQPAGCDASRSQRPHALDECARRPPSACACVRRLPAAQGRSGRRRRAALPRRARADARGSPDRAGDAAGKGGAARGTGCRLRRRARHEPGVDPGAAAARAVQANALGQLHRMLAGR